MKRRGGVGGGKMMDVNAFLFGLVTRSFLNLDSVPPLRQEPERERIKKNVVFMPVAGEH